MKRILKVAALLAFLPITGYAANASFVKTGGGDNSIIGTLADEAGLAYNRLYYLPAAAYSGKKVSAVVTYSSVTYANVTFSTANITLATGNIAVTAHGLTNALPVLLTQTAGTLPVPLVDQTTYYAIWTDANDIKLATTSAQAVAIDPIIFISSTVTATQTYTLSAPALTGTPGLRWQGANIGATAFDMEISSITMSAFTAGGASVGYHFTHFNYAKLIMDVDAPTTGGIDLLVEMMLKK